MITRMVVVRVLRSTLSSFLESRTCQPFPGEGGFLTTEGGDGGTFSL
jgi:hypothetical protein